MHTLTVSFQVEGSLPHHSGPSSSSYCPVSLMGLSIGEASSCPHIKLGEAAGLVTAWRLDSPSQMKARAENSSKLGPGSVYLSTVGCSLSPFFNYSVFLNSRSSDAALIPAPGFSVVLWV